MKKLRIILFTFFALFFVSCDANLQNEKTNYEQFVQTGDIDCDKEKLKVISLLAELAKFRSSNAKPFSEEDDKKIRQLVQKLDKKEDLIMLAKLTRLIDISPTASECLNTNIEDTYSRAFWRSIEILAEDRSEKNLDEMKRLKNELNIDGGDSYTWSNIVDRIPAP